MTLLSSNIGNMMCSRTCETFEIHESCHPDIEDTPDVPPDLITSRNRHGNLVRKQMDLQTPHWFKSFPERFKLM